MCMCAGTHVKPQEDYLVARLMREELWSKGLGVTRFGAHKVWGSISLQTLQQMEQKTDIWGRNLQMSAGCKRGAVAVV